jgi:UDP-N-acetylglucosamine--N-acetylmuramyl-(pentapeptide) pyrophosphoryl-undecaprenol N-acetylglucosamine transferase
VYPSLSVARALGTRLHARGETLDMLYVGIRGRVDEVVVPREGVPFRAISAGQLRVSSPLKFIANVARLAWGAVQSTRILLGFKPDAVFATGGYASVPVGVAARLTRKPLIVYLPDVTPGWAVRMLSRLATRMATTAPRALAYLPKDRTSVVGYPVRGDFWSLDRPAARAKLRLPADGQIVLITGASLGARRINEAVVAQLPRLVDRATILHVTGPGDEAWALAERAKLPEEQRERYVVRGYMDELPTALIAADLVIGRAGASVLGEFPAAGVPSILVPGEYDGWSQDPNAEYMQAEGAAVMLRNAELARLTDVIIELLDDDARRARMAAAARTLARPNAANDIANMLMEAAA